MKRTLYTFRGEVPRVAASKLPDGYAAEAINPRLLSGDLERWGYFGFNYFLTKELPINTIYYLGETAWLEFGAEMEPYGGHMDIARGVIPGDTTYRVYLTGGDAPRYTNLAMATAGPAPYPYETRLLGVPAPTTAPEVAVNSDPIDPESPEAGELNRNVTDDGSNFTGWTAGPVIDIDLGEGLTANSYAQQDNDAGNPSPCYNLVYGTNNVENVDWPYMHRNFGTGNDAVVIFESQFFFGAQTFHLWHVNNNAGGSGPCVMFTPNMGIGAGNIWLGQSTGWGKGVNFQSVVNTPIAPTTVGAWLTMSVSLVKQSDGTRIMTAKVKDAADTVLGEVSLANAGGDGGEYCGIEAGLPGSITTGGLAFFDNFVTQSGGSTNTSTTPTSSTSPPEESTDPTATAYVYTFVNDLGEESAPSPPSLTVLRPDGVTTTVTMATVPPTGPEYYIDTKRLYRAVTGATGTSFQFVAEIPLEQATFDDNLTDLQLGETLESDDWDLPPVDLRGILALPNGVMAGFRRNQLCFSVQNRPHAWPVAYRLTTDTDIVGIGAVGTTVVIGTESFPYIASGNNPAAYSMEKIEVPQACVAKRGIASVSGLGVLFPTPDGLMAIAGPGRPINVTDGLFTRDEWQFLNPQSFIAVAHDDRYWAFYIDQDGNQRGMILDPKQGGFGKITLAFHATAAYSDPITDELYLVLDASNNPESPIGPPPSNPDANGNVIYAWNQETSEEQLQYSYTSPLWMLERPAYFAMAQVKARDYGNIVASFYADGNLIYSKQVNDSREFTLPPIEAELTFQVNITGTSHVSQVQVVEDVDELE